VAAAGTETFNHGESIDTVVENTVEVYMFVLVSMCFKGKNGFVLVSMRFKGKEGFAMVRKVNY